MSATVDRQGTIYAVSSGAGRSAIAVLRLSGPAAVAIVKGVAGALPSPRAARLMRLRHPRTGETLDRGLVLFFPAPASFTGEDCAEFHVHGGRAVMEGLIAAIAVHPEARPAEAGEFARRALANGKLDLAQIEGLGDLVAAETAQQRRQALRQSEGALGARAARWRAVLIEAGARLESRLDFADEAEVANAGEDALAPLIAPLIADLEAELASAKAGERIREGLSIVIAGPPNAGKSTLLNALARRDAAIVSPEAGTTRDCVEVALDLGGYAVTLTDTAGLREADGAVERIGVARARERARRADLVLWLSAADATQAPEAGLSDAPVWRIGAKADLGATVENVDLTLSAATGEGLDALLARLESFAAATGGSGCEGVVTRERHRLAILDAAQALRPLVDARLPDEIAAEHLRMALFALERLVGRVDVEDILDEIFSRFCIGK
ncbi:tRNA uridine-5-carboxymethylaminomethyl(34) synthesis GTPase MnmE [Methylocella sp.]|uniref:tRNA uridine-5-carboxymethylaminomethyl(34) synthesis GTPase MnmE n=1 Tax=Methylocella sp. TaxID=1978226 RepID=UPI0035AE29F2